MSIKVSNLTAEMGGAITIRIYGPASSRDVVRFPDWLKSSVGEGTWLLPKSLKIGQTIQKLNFFMVWILDMKLQGVLNLPPEY